MENNIFTFCDELFIETHNAQEMSRLNNQVILWTLQTTTVHRSLLNKAHLLTTHGMTEAAKLTIAV